MDNHIPDILPRKIERSLLAKVKILAKPSLFKIVTVFLLGGVSLAVYFVALGASLGCLISLGCSENPLNLITTILLAVLVVPTYGTMMLLSDYLYQFNSVLAVSLSAVMTGVIILFQVLYLYAVSALLDRVLPKLGKCIAIGLMIFLLVLTTWPIWKNYQDRKQASTERFQQFSDKFYQDTGIRTDQVFILDKLGLKVDSIYNNKSVYNTQYDINYTNEEGTHGVYINIYLEENSNMANSRASQLLNFSNHKSYYLIDKYGNHVYDIQEVGGEGLSIRYLWTSNDHTILFSSAKNTDYATVLKAYLKKYPSSVTDEIENWQKYNDDKYGLAFKYPKDWSMMTEHSPTSSIPVVAFKSPDGKYKFAIESNCCREGNISYRKVDGGISGGDVQFYNLYGHAKSLDDTEIDPNNSMRFGLYQIGTFQLKTSGGLNGLLEFEIFFDKQNEDSAVEVFNKILSTVYFTK